jgi:hypothetical protein
MLTLTLRKVDQEGVKPGPARLYANPGYML